MAAYAGRGAHGQTVEHLGRRILTGALEEGATIDPVALESELDVSRTVVREALRVLAAKGLVGARQKRGTFVLPRAEWNLLDGDILRWQFEGRTDPAFFESLHEVRLITEPAGARLAAQRRTDDDLAALEAALAAMADAGNDPGAAVKADLAFHRALLAATHNELLLRMEAVIEAGLMVRDRLVHGGGRRVADPVPSHRTVLEAVRRGSAAKAERAMRALLDQAVEDLSHLAR
ncbi:FadR/GntR family transcriptional regulator [Actinopolymorpha alba]|uniref:FadR/GntR family transcriptional regulator n=1 Tax=Actinopolymorpha alba TaxID=533267 RepID=UPI00058AF496|nr:FCD domain-containing protein [Actinopolymorpha alba]